MTLLAWTLSLGTGFSVTNDYSSCFIPGEVSEYKVSWMGLPLAWSKTSTDAIEMGGRKLIRIRMISKNYKAYSSVYKVDDKTEVIIDPKTALPIQLDFILNEGSRHKNHLTTFDHSKAQATFIDRASNTTNTISISKNTRDVVTFLYASRKSNMEQLATENQKIYVEGKINDMRLKRGKTKNLKLGKLGKIKSNQLEPIADFNGLFLRQGRIFFWVSDTPHRMITLTEAKVPIGKIKVKLQKVTGINDPFWSGTN